MPKADEAKTKYYSVLVEEEMTNLGENICWFRHLWSDLEKQEITDVKYIDAIYQQAFDKVIDALCNVNDLKCADIAINAIDKSMKIRRGMKIKEF